eukprot:5139272-Pleurochrysis_carterae.AAC.1
MGGRDGLPPDPALSVASPPCRSRPAPAPPSAPRAASPSFLSARCFAAGSLPPSAGGSGSAHLVRRPRGPRAAAPAA